MITLSVAGLLLAAVNGYLIHLIGVQRREIDRLTRANKALAAELHELSYPKIGSNGISR
jgi:Tfp pilus assembly protein PilN